MSDGKKKNDFFFITNTVACMVWISVWIRKCRFLFSLSLNVDYSWLKIICEISRAEMMSDIWYVRHQWHGDALDFFLFVACWQYSNSNKVFIKILLQHSVCPNVVFSVPVLDIQRCDLNIENNNRSHHTELNGVERLIVRRGQTFTIILYLKPDSPEFRIGRTKLTLIAETGLFLIYLWFIIFVRWRSVS